MHPFILVFIELCFIMLFVVILIDIKKRKNISLATNTILVLLAMMIIKLFMYLWAMMNNLNMCQFSNVLYCN